MTNIVITPGDIELAGYISQGAQDLVLELPACVLCRHLDFLPAISSTCGGFIASCCACCSYTRTGRLLPPSFVSHRSLSIQTVFLRTL